MCSAGTVCRRVRRKLSGLLLLLLLKASAAGGQVQTAAMLVLLVLQQLRAASRWLWPEALLLLLGRTCGNAIWVGTGRGRESVRPAALMWPGAGIDTACKSDTTQHTQQVNCLPQEVKMVTVRPGLGVVSARTWGGGLLDLHIYHAITPLPSYHEHQPLVLVPFACPLKLLTL
jgi:hypothetical protein